MTLDEIIQQVEDGVAGDRAHLDELLTEYAVVNSAIRLTRKRESELKEQIKNLINQLRLNGEEIIAVDPQTETTYKVTLSDVEKIDYDLISMAQAAPDYIVELGRLGVLSTSTTAIKRLTGKRAAVDALQKRYSMPGQQQRLHITEVK